MEKAYLAGYLHSRLAKKTETSIELTVFSSQYRIFKKFTQFTSSGNKTIISFTEKDKEYNDNFKGYFYRGYFEGNCIIKTPKKIKFVNTDASITNDLNYYFGVSFDTEIKDNTLLDLLGQLYEDKGELYSPRIYNLYKKLCDYNPPNSPFVLCKKTLENAELPFKKHISDSGYDLSLVREVSKTGDLVMYDTGISIEPSFGFYFDLVPRSSIYKTGYILANNIGVIDRTYRGSIKVPLIKIDHTKPDLELPCRIVQIIPRKISHLRVIKVEEVSETTRNEGGFGSTGN